MAKVSPQKAVLHHHTSLGIAAAITGVALGFLVVYIDDLRDPQLAVYAQGSGSCQQQEQTCASKNGHGACHSAWVQCMTKKCIGTAGAAGQCNQDPECQASCTESATSQGGKLSCCDGGPQHGNTCRDKVDGKCNPKATELGKEKGAGEGKGGEGKMPELPLPKMPEKGGGGSGGGQPPPEAKPTEEECKKEPKPVGCPTGVASGLFDRVSDMFKSDTKSEGSTEPSALDKLKSLFTGTPSEPSPTATPPAVNNPTEAQVTPVVVSGSNAAQLRGSQESTAAGSPSGNGAGPVNTTVTGFGSNAQADVNTSTGPILAGIRNVTTRIRDLLSSMF